MKRASSLFLLTNGLVIAMQPGIEMSAKKVALITQAKDKIVMFNQIQEAADWLWKTRLGYTWKLAELRLFLYQKSADDTNSMEFVEKRITQLDHIRDFTHIRCDNFVWRHVLASQDPAQDDLVVLGTKDPIILQRLRRLLERPEEREAKYCLKLLALKDEEPAPAISELEKVNVCSVSWY